MSLQDLLLGNQYFAQQAALAASRVATSSLSGSTSIQPASNAGPSDSSQLANNLSTKPATPVRSMQITHHQQQPHQQQQPPQQQQQQKTDNIASSAANCGNRSPLQVGTNLKLSTQHSQWNHYQQAVAAALMSSIGAANPTAFASALVDQQLHQQQQLLTMAHNTTQPMDVQLRQQQQSLLALLMNLTSNQLSFSPLALNTDSSPINPSLNIDHQIPTSKYSPNNNNTTYNNGNNNDNIRQTNKNNLCNQQQIIAAMMQQQQFQQYSLMHQHQQQQQLHQHEILDDSLISTFTKTSNQLQLSSSFASSPFQHLTKSSLTPTSTGGPIKAAHNGSRFNPMRPQMQQKLHHLNHQHQQQLTSNLLLNSKLKSTLSTHNPLSATTTNTTNNNSNTVDRNTTSDNNTNTADSKCLNHAITTPPSSPLVQAISPQISSTSYWRLLESLFDMNEEPEEEAIELIARRINSTSTEVANWFQSRREAERNLCNSTFPSTPTNIINENTKTVPSSTLLAKLSAVTSRSNSNLLATNLDQKMIDLLDAFYAINDNPELAAIEMIAKRINTTVEAISDWFDEKRIKANPLAGPRSPPAKKREGGRVVTFSEYQRSLLEAIFDENNYLHPQEYEELSNLIQVPSRNIKIWFKNRRSKQRLSGRTTTPASVNNSN